MGLFSKIFQKKQELTEEELQIQKINELWEKAIKEHGDLAIVVSASGIKYKKSKKKRKKDNLNEKTESNILENFENSNLSEEDLKWNKMWDLWTEGELEQPISSLLTYDSEIQNGGHLQFFCNLEEREEPELKDILKNLKELLPEELYNNLDKAYQEYKKLNFNPQTSEEYCEVEIEEPLLEYDDFYYENEETIQNILKEYSLKIEL